MAQSWQNLAAAQIRTELVEYCRRNPELGEHVIKLWGNMTEARMAEIIGQYCPFKLDTAYEPVNLGVVAQMTKGVDQLLDVCRFVSNHQLSECSPALRDAIVGLRLLCEKNKPVLQCTQCSKRTVPLEAAQRRSGSCDACGGPFVVTME